MLVRCLLAAGATVLLLAAAALAVTKIKPVATTKPASKVGAFKATLNGIAGPGPGDSSVTQYHFAYGTTKSYGHNTPTGSLTTDKAVSARVSSLMPCQTYHFRITATNGMGTSNGQDLTFKTAFVNPLVAAALSPNPVGAGKNYQIATTLRYRVMNVTIEVLHKGVLVASYSMAPHGTGMFTITKRAPAQTGTYDIRWLIKSNCGTQRKDKFLIVS